MTRQHAAIKLFEHGPLTRYEFIEITGWTRTTAGRTLYRLVDGGWIKRIERGFFALVEAV